MIERRGPARLSEPEYRMLLKNLGIDHDEEGRRIGEVRRVMPFLQNDVARCRGVYDEEDGTIYWREGCENCVRRLAPANGDSVANMNPPAIIAFWCEFHIEA